MKVKFNVRGKKPLKSCVNKKSINFNKTRVVHGRKFGNGKIQKFNTQFTKQVTKQFPKQFPKQVTKQFAKQFTKQFSKQFPKMNFSSFNGKNGNLKQFPKQFTKQFTKQFPKPFAFSTKMTSNNNNNNMNVFDKVNTISSEKLNGLKIWRNRKNNENNNNNNQQEEEEVDMKMYDMIEEAAIIKKEEENNNLGLGLLLLIAVASAALAEEDGDNVDYHGVRKEIVQLLEDDENRGPLFIRLGWHASGTFCRHTQTGGSDGATMDCNPESNHGANAGLEVARELLRPIAEKYDGLSKADLWTLAAAVAVEEMNGPKIHWRAGRSDRKPYQGTPTPPDRLPDAEKSTEVDTVTHVKHIFNRMGFNTQETVALIGAHALGRCHVSRSGYDGAWTRAPTTFSNEFFRLLVEEQWTVRQWNGPTQYENMSKDLMMLPADMALTWDRDMNKVVKFYANDEAAFFKDFAAAFAKLLELGCNNLHDVSFSKKGKKKKGKKKRR